MSRKNRKRMSFLKAIETFILVNYFVFSAASSWIICESAPNTGRNWVDDEFIHIYKPDFKLDWKPQRFDFEDGPTIPSRTAVWIAIGFSIFAALSILFACVMMCRWVRKHSTRTDVPSEHRTFVHQSPFNELQVSGGNRDVPPSYAAVSERSSTLGSGGKPTTYPRIAEGKNMETPPPEYMTVAPFQ